MGSPAKFLVLLDASSRAMLFDSEQRLVGEVIEDDGFIVDGLLRSARQFPSAGLPDLDSPPFPPPSLGPARCFELGCAAPLPMEPLKPLNRKPPTARVRRARSRPPGNADAIGAPAAHPRGRLQQHRKD